MPRDFVLRWPELAELAALVEDHTSTGDAVVQLPALSIGRNTRQGFLTDTKLRLLIEQYSVSLGIRHFESDGFTVQVKGKPYDLRCSKGAQVLYVEVKGTTTSGAQVILTPNEVAFAEANKASMALFLVSDIAVRADSDEPTLEGGTITLFHPWQPDRRFLQPLGFTYDLEGARSISARCLVPIPLRSDGD